MSHFFITKSRSLKIRYHVPSSVEPGRESLTSTLESQQLDGQLGHVAALGSSFISCTTLGVRTPVTLIAEFPWVVTPGAMSREAISSILKSIREGESHIIKLAVSLENTCPLLVLSYYLIAE